MKPIIPPTSADDNVTQVVVREEQPAVVMQATIEPVAEPVVVEIEEVKAEPGPSVEVQVAQVAPAAAEIDSKPVEKEAKPIQPEIKAVPVQLDVKPIEAKVQAVSVQSQTEDDINLKSVEVEMTSDWKQAAREYQLQEEAHLKGWF